MARKYSRGASKDVEREMHKFKRGKLKSGKGGRGGRVKSRKQAIAIGLSEARKRAKGFPSAAENKNQFYWNDFRPALRLLLRRPACIFAVPQILPSRTRTKTITSTRPMPPPP